jgi:hypothetical protein
MHIIIEAFHILPLVLIVALIATQAIWKIVKKQILVIQQLDPLLLVLSAIGTAAGANAHSHDTSMLFDPCFGYAAVSICVAAKMLGFFKSRKVSHA